MVSIIPINLKFPNKRTVNFKKMNLKGLLGKIGLGSRIPVN